MRSMRYLTCAHFCFKVEVQMWITCGTGVELTAHETVCRAC